MGYTILPVDLHLFADGAAAPTGAGETQAGPAATPQGNTGDLSKVQYGKQPEVQAPDAGENSAAAQASTPEARQKAFDDLVNGEYKDVYTKRTQELIDRRFAKAKAAEAENSKLREITDMLSTKYGIDGDLTKLKSALESDDDIWTAAAEENGMTVEQYRKFTQLQRQNAAFEAARRNDIAAQQQREKAEKWYGEAQEVKTKFPQFDLKAELSDPNFMAAINAGVPMELVYKGKYYDQFLGEAEQTAARTTEKALVDNIRAKGKRPSENGTASQSAFTVKNDPSKLTLADFDEIARRAKNGEKVTF